MTLIPLKNIIVRKGRGRKTFTGLQEMADSLKEHGQIHPIVVVPTDNGKYYLVVGERRYRGACLAKWTEIEATMKDDLSEQQQKEVELEENLRRHDLDWQEQGELLTQIDELKRVVKPEWTQKETAESLGHDPGGVSRKIDMARKLRERPDIKAYLKERGLPFAASVREVKLIEKKEKLERLVEGGHITLVNDFKNGDCLALIKDLADKSVDCVVCDPPYGVDKVTDLATGNDRYSKMTGYRTMKLAHNLDLVSILSLLEKLAPELARVLKDGSHFYMFCAVQYTGAFIRVLEPHLEFQPPMLVWDRGKPTTPGFGYNYINRCETIIYGYKPPRTRRLNSSKYNVLVHPEVPKSMRIYPTEKPVSLLRELIEQSTNVGEIVLDPFAGSASTLLACTAAGRRGIGFEIDKEIFMKAQERLLHGTEVQSR